MRAQTPGASKPSQCALICEPNGMYPNGGCPMSAKCQPIQGLGICTTPAPPPSNPRGVQLNEATKSDCEIET